ncbi:MAG: recombinase family protein [Bacteriovoracia bacterium]
MEAGSLKAAGYARVSTLLGQNPELQLTNIRAFAQARGFTLMNEYVDYVSGTRERRKALDTLVKDARMGRFKILIVSGIDRLARDTRHLLNLIHELDGYGVSLISLRESIDFTSAMGKATLTILGAVASLERELCAERVRSAMAAKKLTSHITGWTCGRRPLSKDVQDEILTLHHKGMSYRQISKMLSGRASKSSVDRVIRAQKQKCRQNERQIVKITSCEANKIVASKTNGCEASTRYHGPIDFRATHKPKRPGY